VSRNGAFTSRRRTGEGSFGTGQDLEWFERQLAKVKWQTVLQFEQTASCGPNEFCHLQFAV
jgi:hypothetical protein